MSEPSNEKKYTNDNIIVDSKADEFVFTDFWEIFLRRWPIVVIFLIAFVVLGIYRISRQPVKYESACKVVMKTQSRAGSYDLSMISNLAALTGGKSISANIEAIKDYGTLKAAFDQLTDAEKQKGFNSLTCPPNLASVENATDADYVIIKVKCLDPEIAAKTANNIADAYFDRDIELQRKFTRQAINHVEEEMANISKDLTGVRKELAAYKKETGIYLPEEGTDIVAALERRATVDSELEKAKIELESAKASLKALEEASSTEPDKEVTSVNQTNPSVAAIMTRIDNLTSQKNELLQKFQPDSPEVTAVSNQIEFETRKLAEAKDKYVESSRTYADSPVKTGLKTEKNKLKVTISELTARVANLAALDSKKNREASALPDTMDKFLELQEQYKILQATMAQLTQQYYTLSINAETSLNSGYILSKAIPNMRPVEPSVKKNVAIFFLLGLIFGLMGAYVWDNLDNAIHDDDTVNKITTLPCLGRIPLVELAPGERAQLGMSKKDQLLEPFRIFRNNVLFSHYESNDKVLAITGPDAKQGKSTISVNLAIVLALDGKKVLLVDADLRKPNIARWFGLKNNIGYSNLVKGLCTYEEAIRESGIPGLSLLTTGPLPPNPAEFLSSKANLEVVEKLKTMFDYIIYDTSPCTFISDSQIVATYVDGMIMTVTCKQTKRNSLKFALDAMKTVNAPLVGYVLNKLPMTKRGYYSKYYYYSSYSSYTDEDTRRKK